MSNEKNDGGPAFPFEHATKSGPNGTVNEWVYCDGMTLRQYACIYLRVPETGEEWLDDIIRRAQKDDFAAKAMQAMVSNGGSLAGDGGTASRAYGMADAMLKAREE